MRPRPRIAYLSDCLIRDDVWSEKIVITGLVHHKFAMRRVLAIAAVALLAGVTGANGVSASATTLPGAVTSVSLSPMNPAPGQSVRLDLTWAVPDSARGGDTFTMDLPDELNRISRSFTMMNAAGDEVATALVSEGHVAFTLTDFVNIHNGVHGTAYFWVQLSHDVTPGEVMTLDFGSVTTVVTPGDPGGESEDVVDRSVATKRGFWSKEEDHSLLYAVDTPIGPFLKVNFDDRLGEGQRYVCDGDLAPMVVFYGIDPTTGYYDDEIQLPPTGDVSVIACGGDGLRVSVANVPTNFVAELKYWAQATDIGRAYYTNTARVTADVRTDEVNTLVVRAGAGGDGEGFLPEPAPVPEPGPVPAPDLVPEADPEPEADTVPTPSPVPEADPIGSERVPGADDPTKQDAGGSPGLLAVTGARGAAMVGATALAVSIIGAVLLRGRRAHVRR